VSVVERRWFAVQTKARHEKRVAAELRRKGLVAFLPLTTKVHQWSDRKRRVELPLFSTIRVRLASAASRTLVSRYCRQTVCLVFVGPRGTGSSIPDEQIDTLQTIVRAEAPFSPHPFLSLGQKVRIRGGSLDGVWWIPLGDQRRSSLVVSVESIQRSIAIRIAWLSG